MATASIAKLLLWLAKCTSVMLVGLTAFVSVYPGIYTNLFAGYKEGETWYGVREYTTVTKLTGVVGTVAANCQMVFPNWPDPDFIGLGFFQGYTPGGWWYENPQWYFDGSTGGFWPAGYFCVRMGPAPIGTNHRYTIQYQYSTDTWELYIDGQLRNTRYEFPYTVGYAVCQSETTTDVNPLTYHHWGCQELAGLFGPWGDFHDPTTFQDPPLVLLEISDTEFWTWNPESG